MHLLTISVVIVQQVILHDQISLRMLQAHLVSGGQHMYELSNIKGHTREIQIVEKVQNLQIWLIVGSEPVVEGPTGYPWHDQKTPSQHNQGCWGLERPWATSLGLGLSFHLEVK